MALEESIVWLLVAALVAYLIVKLCRPDRRKDQR